MLGIGHPFIGDHAYEIQQGNGNVMSAPNSMRDKKHTFLMNWSYTFTMFCSW